ncbi:3-epi-6-deoxocathasterone 23-monooxygenase [Senna tora]|uniref:3-epi-6-deoxocathasterone 23-monooxygenase n=1 Tax=Senna tora TaxID=362788 RepID=A0A834SG56_9FABA|nr:3-epi-6-deoxocathasterone 23-monooxygenase [Senna tora]
MPLRMLWLGTKLMMAPLLYFLWRLGHESIMTNTNRLKRGFTSNDICQRYGEFPETVLHAVRDCKWNKPVWELLIHRSAKNSFFSGNLRDWIEDNLTAHNGRNKGLPWSTTFAIGAWMCWKQRNDEIFNKKTTDVNYLVQRILNQVLIYIKAAETRDLVNNVLDENCMNGTSWQAPSNGWSKVNVDGSWKMDTDIRLLTLRNWDVNIRYVQRSGNIAADLMAKNGHNLPYGAKMYPNPLDICISAFHARKTCNNCFTPFGGGQRLCPGLELSRLELPIFLHHLVTTYRWEAEKDEIIYFPTVKIRRKLPIRVKLIN